MPFPKNHLNDFSNDLNGFGKLFRQSEQTIRIKIENHLDDFREGCGTRHKTVVKRLQKASKKQF